MYFYLNYTATQSELGHDAIKNNEEENFQNRSEDPPSVGETDQQPQIPEENNQTATRNGRKILYQLLFD